MPESTITRPTIVCVDDDVPLLHSLREQLLRGLDRTCDVELATNGAEALKLLEELAADGVPVPLIICDQLMPGMRGVDVLASAHRLYPELLTVLLTGQADMGAVSKAVNQANLYRLLTKPWQEQDLVLTVKEALRRTQQDHALAQRGAELAAANEHLEQSLQMLQATMDATPDGLLVLGRDGQPLLVNRRFVEMWSVPQEIADAKPGAALLEHLRGQFVEPELLALGAGGEPLLPVVAQCTHGRAMEFSGRPFLLRGQSAGAVYGFRDVTERERHARKMRHQALHDILTGLPNRLQFMQALDEALVEASATGTALSVMFVDLDHFKRINDTLGHESGDRLLTLVGQRLARCVRGSDMVARWGGDEFTILLRRDAVENNISNMAQRIMDALLEPVSLDGIALRVSASIGISSFPTDAQSGYVLLRRADMALYRAKEDGRHGYRIFSESAFAGLDAHNDVSLEPDLFTAIERGELHLHYQPQFDTRTGAFVAVEALARWLHPVHGPISPSTFIPIAERNGSIGKLGRWVLETACAQAAWWQAQGLGEIRIAVNLSPAQVLRGDLHADVRNALAASSLRTDLLELEVTEAAAIRNVEQVAANLAVLRAEGVRIALDDFGTGHSSLTYLKQLPCDTLKIDRSFVLGAAANARDASIILGLVTMASGMDVQVVAEGVESHAVAEALKAAGCQLMQGYHFCRPVPAKELTELLRKLRASTALEQSRGSPTSPTSGPLTKLPTCTTVLC